MSPRGWAATALLAALGLAAMPPVHDPGPALASLPSDVEVLRDERGAYAFRARASDGRWQTPPGDAVLLAERWWTPLRPLVPVAIAPLARATRRLALEKVAPGLSADDPDRLYAMDFGDVTLDGEADLVLAFRRPFRRTFINITRPRRAWVDEHGLSAHLGLYRPGDLREMWVAGTLARPVVDVAACDGALAVAYGDLRHPGTVATDAWRWVVFGFLPVEPLPGAGTPICVDIDADGRTEPAIKGRDEP